MSSSGVESRPASNRYASIESQLAEIRSLLLSRLSSESGTSTSPEATAGPTEQAHLSEQVALLAAKVERLENSVRSLVRREASLAIPSDVPPSTNKKADVVANHDDLSIQARAADSKPIICGLPASPDSILTVTPESSTPSRNLVARPRISRGVCDFIIDYVSSPTDARDDDSDDDALESFIVPTLLISDIDGGAAPIEIKPKAAVVPVSASSILAKRAPPKAKLHAKGSDRSLASDDPLPRPYFYFFSIVEPLLTYIGAIYAIVTPTPYFVSLFPASILPAPVVKAIHPASIMATRQLGSCFFLFALMGSVMVPRVRTVLKSRPVELEEFVEAYLFCLAAADLTHIGFTLYDLGYDGATKPFVHWNQLVVGNVLITTGLFVVRMLWFAGIGRASSKVADDRRKLQ
ncbi:hypothetical protein JCM10212_006291 [Sporobolomyces blumeae]